MCQPAQVGPSRAKPVVNEGNTWGFTREPKLRGLDKLLERIANSRAVMFFIEVNP